MKLPSDIKKCVVFVGLQMADKTMRIVGTGFLVGDDLTPGRRLYIVTAKHVLNGIHGNGLDEVFIRVNLKDGSSKWLTTQYTDWKLNSDENVDVGIYAATGDSTWDHGQYALSTCLTEHLILENEIDVGDEVFIIGMFTHHHGQRKNIPIARIGNISAMKEEKIQTSQHIMDGYLIEARSIGGLSGSPVFVNLGLIRYVQGSVKHSVGGRAFMLMGLVYGHYDVKSTNIDLADTDTIDSAKVVKVNTGIAIVTPVEKIVETIRQ